MRRDGLLLGILCRNIRRLRSTSRRGCPCRCSHGIGGCSERISGFAGMEGYPEMLDSLFVIVLNSSDEDVVTHIDLVSECLMLAVYLGMCY